MGKTENFMINVEEGRVLSRESSDKSVDGRNELPRNQVQNEKYELSFEEDAVVSENLRKYASKI